APADAVPEVAERLRVDPARIDVVGIGAQVEGPFAEVIKAFIHDGRLSRRCCLVPRPYAVGRRPVRRPRWLAGRPRTRASSPWGNPLRSTESPVSRRRGGGGAGQTSRM